MQASVNERELVLDMLLQITRDGEYSHIVIKNVLDKYQYLDKRERAFITRVVNGTLERMIEIDYIINLFSKVKVNKMKPLIRTILRSSVYQMKYMDSVPDSAICNEAVKLAGKRGFVNLKGFVNGVLRNISRNLDKINYPDEKDKVSYLSVKYSLPEWLVKQWLNVYDEETVKTIGSAFLEEKPLTVRFNEHKIKKEDLVGILKKEGVEDQVLFDAICAHNPKSGVKAKTNIQYALLAADPMSGFVKAVAQIYPDKKIASVKRKSVLKRFNEARFAKGANRDYMESIEFTGLMLEDLIDIGLEEMCAISDELGL